MDERVIGQPLTEVTIFRCPSCDAVVKNRFTKTPYLCPLCGKSRLYTSGVEYEETDALHFTTKSEPEKIA